MRYTNIIIGSFHVFKVGIIEASYLVFWVIAELWRVT